MERHWTHFAQPEEFVERIAIEVNRGKVLS
jgi:hypothetical protein